jgi:hypothetical protein
VASGGLTFVSLATRKQLIDLELEEGLDVFISFDASAIHTF